MQMHEFLTGHREQILSRALQTLKTSYPDRTAHELFDDVPQFLDEVTDVLRRDAAGESATALFSEFGVPTAHAYGSVRQGQGFDSDLPGVGCVFTILLPRTQRIMD